MEDHQGRQENFHVVEEGEARRRGHGRGLGWAAELGARRSERAQLRRFLRRIEGVGRRFVLVRVWDLDVSVLGSIAAIALSWTLPARKRDGREQDQQHGQYHFPEGYV